MTTRLDALVARWLPASPLRHAAFRCFYFASIGVALGYTMQTTMAAWLMATLTPSALMVALVQTASTAPALLFGLVAGALSDIVDRRRIILSTQVSWSSSPPCWASPRSSAYIVPGALLHDVRSSASAFTFYLPAQRASVNELVGRRTLPRRWRSAPWR